MENNPYSFVYSDESPAEMDLLAAASIGNLSHVIKILQRGE